MDEAAFRKFLKRTGRSKSAVESIVELVRAYETFLNKQPTKKNLDNAKPNDLVAYTTWYEETKGKPAKRQLWGICYYYSFIENKEMEHKASQLREQRTAKKRKFFRLRDLRGVNLEYVIKLEKHGIRNVEQMRQHGRTKKDREELAKQTNIPLEVILELVKLSDLSRLPGVKGIRTRLYYDAGVDTLEVMAKWDAKELRAMLIEFVEKTGFEGIAPLPKEAASSIRTAKTLPRIIEYD
jgi:hypothetical protein